MAIKNGPLERLPFQSWQNPEPSDLVFLNLDLYKLILHILGHELIATLSLTSKTFYNLTNDPQVLRFLLRSLDEPDWIPRTLYIRIFPSHAELVSQNIKNNHYAVEQGLVCHDAWIEDIEGTGDLLLITVQNKEQNAYCNIIFRPRLDSISTLNKDLNENMDQLCETHRGSYKCTVSNRYIAKFMNKRFEICDWKKKTTLFESSKPHGMILIGDKLYYHPSDKSLNELHVLDIPNATDTLLLQHVIGISQCSPNQLLIVGTESVGARYWSVFNTKDNSCTPFLSCEEAGATREEVRLDMQQQFFAAKIEEDGEERVAIYKYDKTLAEHKCVHTIFGDNEGVDIKNFEWKHGCLWIQTQHSEIYQWNPEDPKNESIIDFPEEDADQRHREHSFAWVHEKLFIQPSRGEGFILNFAPGEEVLAKCLSACHDDADLLELWLEYLVDYSTLQGVFSHCNPQPESLKDQAWKGLSLIEKKSAIGTYIQEKQKERQAPQIGGSYRGVKRSYDDFKNGNTSE